MSDVEASSAPSAPSSSSPTASPVPGASAVEPAIEVKGLVKRFGPAKVLDGADLTVMPGEFVALAGRSGAGKSTLLHLLAALDTPDAGTIRVAGRNIGRHSTQLSRYRRDDIGIIFQLHNLIPRLTARQNVELAMFGTRRSRRARRLRADEVLTSLGLGDRGRSRPPKMSGGERQRVAVARALANEPAVLLADEPSGSLDDESAEAMLKVLRALVDSGRVAVLAVTHDPRVSRVADRRLRLSDGVIAPA